MNFDYITFVMAILSALYFIMPAYIANLSALTFGGTTPVDLGKTFFDGKRIIGDGVTWKGLIYGTITGTLVGAIEGVLIWDPVYGLIVGFLLSFGALLGDATGSFIKRRLGVAKGKPFPTLDQLDFVAGALILVSIYTTISWDAIVIIAVLTVIIHLVSNIVAYIIGIKDVWY